MLGIQTLQVPGVFHSIGMARTPSTMLALGTPAPDFSLPDTNGNLVSLSQFQGQKGLIVAFICNHCPYVQMLRSSLAQSAKEFQAQGLGFVGINSNDADNFPEDSPEKMAQEVEQQGYEFPYLFDADQAIAQKYQAACTPDFYLFDSELKLVYRGQYDNARPNSGIEVTGENLKKAVSDLLAGQKIDPVQKPSLGCNIKWKAGNEPQYFQVK